MGKKLEDISPEELSLFISKGVSYLVLKEIYSKMPIEIKEQINFEKSLEFLIDIEKELFKYNRIRRTPNKIVVALYFSSKLTQDFLCSYLIKQGYNATFGAMRILITFLFIGNKELESKFRTFRETFINPLIEMPKKVIQRKANQEIAIDLRELKEIVQNKLISNKSIQTIDSKKPMLDNKLGGCI